MTDTRTPEPHPAPVTAERLFELIWITLTDFLGSATTATLLRRTRRAVQDRGIDLEDLVITREGLRYSYVVPGCWRDGASHATHATFSSFIEELRSVLVQLTGPVLLRRLDQVPEFAKSSIFFLRGTPP